MFESRVPSFPVNIYVAGDPSDASRICRKFCFENPLCVTVTPTEFVYMGGAEVGVRVGLVNYPRFPADSSEIWGTAVDLAHVLMEGLFQTSALVEGPEETLWLSRREVP